MFDTTSEAKVRYFASVTLGQVFRRGHKFRLTPDFKSRKLREIAVVKIAEKLGTCDMFYTNIEKSSQTTEAMLVHIY